MFRKNFICRPGIRGIEENNADDAQYQNCKGRNHPDIHLLSSVWPESGKRQSENRYGKKDSGVWKDVVYGIFPDCIISGEEKQSS